MVSRGFKRTADHGLCNIQLVTQKHLSQNNRADQHSILTNFLVRREGCMDKKKPYIPPRLTVYERHNVPDGMLFREAPKSEEVTPAYTTVVDNNRTYVEVSQSFCDLVGYKRDELIGTRYDRLTALNTTDIPATYNLFTKLGYMQGLWVLLHRTGYRILIRYEAWLREDSHIESRIEFVQNII
jgi:hypothetical protein